MSRSTSPSTATRTKSVPIEDACVRRRRRALLRWYDRSARPLPWRQQPNSYRIWVSEIMLQQTRIAAVEPAYREFLLAFPDIATLAGAKEEDVLSRWSGLGYYSRARSLHRAARLLHQRGDKIFPRTYNEARALPGVGAYTAAAVLSIAYGQGHAAVDGNVIRVLSRLERLGLPDGSGQPHQALAERLLSPTRPGDWNQALMELGETVCGPRVTQCKSCPLKTDCSARSADVVDRHPPPKPRRKIERVGLSVAILRDRRGRLLLERGGFPHLDHLWLPPIEILPQPPSSIDFKHAIVHRSFAVQVKSRTVTPAEMQRLAAKPGRENAERRVIEPQELAGLGRSSLLTKSLRHADKMENPPS